MQATRLTFVALFLVMWAAPHLFAQSRADRLAEEALREAPAQPTVTQSAEPDGSTKASVNVFELVWTARWLMSPIILMSVIVVMVGIDRSLALRRERVIPRRLTNQLHELASSPVGLDTTRARQACEANYSPLAATVRAMLTRQGRPAADIEQGVADTVQRESESLYRHVRTLNLAAAITPLMGLLGTVWGMIQAFFATANLPVGANKAESLAEGIYTALVTTAGGLMVAIPAAMLAHYFEGRIQRLLAEVEDFTQSRLIPAMIKASRIRGSADGAAARGIGKSTPPAPPQLARSPK